MVMVNNCSNKPKLRIIENIIECKNDIRLYSSLNRANLLYKDSLNKIYLKVDNIPLTDSNFDLSNCQKMPYIFINEMALINDSIVSLENIVDVNTFSRIENTENYFSDKKGVYYYKNDIATYPNLFELKIDISKMRVVNFETIQDDKYRYIKGIQKD